MQNSLEFLIQQVTQCYALFTLSNFSFHITIDAIRFLIRHDNNNNNNNNNNTVEAGLWILRAFGYLGIGNYYLGYLHFQSAIASNAYYPGLTTCLQRVEQFMNTTYIEEQFTAPKEVKYTFKYI
jgi:hypothetical protein